MCVPFPPLNQSLPSITQVPTVRPPLSPFSRLANSTFLAALPMLSQRHYKTFSTNFFPVTSSDYPHTGIRTSETSNTFLPFSLFLLSLVLPTFPFTHYSYKPYLLPNFIPATLPFPSLRHAIDRQGKERPSLHLNTPVHITYLVVTCLYLIHPHRPVT